jgi:hypothetical protein
MAERHADIETVEIPQFEELGTNHVHTNFVAFVDVKSGEGLGRRSMFKFL